MTLCKRSSDIPQPYTLRWDEQGLRPAELKLWQCIGAHRSFQKVEICPDCLSEKMQTGHKYYKLNRLFKGNCPTVPLFLYTSYKIVLYWQNYKKLFLEGLVIC